MAYQKYRNKPVYIDEIRFASQKEGERYIVLKMLQEKKLIDSLVLQPKFKICEAYTFNGKKHRASYYIADFKYYDLAYHKWIVEDVKGFKTPLYKHKRGQFITQYPMFVFKET